MKVKTFTTVFYWVFPAVVVAVTVAVLILVQRTPIKRTQPAVVPEQTSVDIETPGTASPFGQPPQSAPVASPVPVGVQSATQPEEVIASVAANLHAGNIEGALKSFRSERYRKTFKVLSPEGIKSFADFFESATLIEDRGNDRIYSGTSILPGQHTPTQGEFSMTNDEFGQWVIYN